MNVFLNKMKALYISRNAVIPDSLRYCLDEKNSVSLAMTKENIASWNSKQKKTILKEFNMSLSIANKENPSKMEFNQQAFDKVIEFLTKKGDDYASKLQYEICITIRKQKEVKFFIYILLRKKLKKKKIPIIPYYNLFFKLQDLEALRKQIFNEKDEDSKAKLINDLSEKIDKIEI